MRCLLELSEGQWTLNWRIISPAGPLPEARARFNAAYPWAAGEIEDDGSDWREPPKLD